MNKLLSSNSGNNVSSCPSNEASDTIGLGKELGIAFDGEEGSVINHFVKQIKGDMHLCDSKKLVQFAISKVHYG